MPVIFGITWNHAEKRPGMFWSGFGFQVTYLAMHSTAFTDIFKTFQLLSPVLPLMWHVEQWGVYHYHVSLSQTHHVLPFFCIQRKQELSSRSTLWSVLSSGTSSFSLQAIRSGGKNNTNTCTSMFISDTMSFTIHETAAVNLSFEVWGQSKYKDQLLFCPVLFRDKPCSLDLPFSCWALGIQVLVWDNGLCYEVTKFSECNKLGGAQNAQGSCLQKWQMGILWSNTAWNCCHPSIHSFIRPSIHSSIQSCISHWNSFWPCTKQANVIFPILQW